MPTYFVVNATVTDPELLGEYRAVASATAADFGGRVLVSTGEATTIEGQPAGQRLVVVEFPDEDTFRAWYASDAYQAILGKRLASTRGFAVLAGTGT